MKPRQETKISYHNLCEIPAIFYVTATRSTIPWTWASAADIKTSLSMSSDTTYKGLPVLCA